MGVRSGGLLFRGIWPLIMLAAGSDAGGRHGTCVGNTCGSMRLSSYESSYSVSLSSAGFIGSEPNPPPWPASVQIFSAEMPARTLQSAISVAWQTNGRQALHTGPPGQFSEKRYAFLFKPGTYSLDVPVGYYTQVLGLGASPDDVVFRNSRGPYVPCNFTPTGPGACDTFWRSAENFKMEGTQVWAVSQAAPLRRVHITQDLVLVDHNCYASGGFLGNSIIDGTVRGGNQQQWVTRSTQVGAWEGVGWNAVFVGVTTVADQCDLHTNICGTSPYGPKQTVVAQEVPIIAEKPFITVDPRDDRKFILNVPHAHKASRGPDWGMSEAYNFNSVYVTQPADTAARINAKLAEGLHVVITPSIYYLSEPLNLIYDNQVLLCLGLATLVSANGNIVLKVASGVNGVRISGCLLEAGAQQAPFLLLWGEGSYEGNADNPGVLHDLFVRVGGPTNNAAASTMVRIDSGNVVGDNLWLWRADHYDSGDRMLPIHDKTSKLGELPCDHGLVVTGPNVTMYGLAVEHALKDQVVWSGDGGSVYFFQCEIPYDVDPSWAARGYVAYKVDDRVTTHRALGVGVYVYFRDFEVWMASAISTPARLQNAIVQPYVVKLPGQGGIKSIINGIGPGAGFHKAFEISYLNNSCLANCPRAPSLNLWAATLLIVLVAVLGVVCVKFSKQVCGSSRSETAESSSLLSVE